MSVPFAEVQTGSQAAGGTSTASASFSGAGGSNSVYIAFVATRSNVDVTNVTGLGLTWFLASEQCAARAQQRIESWYAFGAGTAGAVTASHAACAASVIAVVHYTSANSDPVSDKESFNTLGAAAICSGGTDNDDAAATSSFTVQTGGWIVGGFNTRNRTMTATAGFNVRVNDVSAGTGGDITTLSVEDRLASGESSPSFGGANNLSGTADWCIAVVSVAPAPAASGVPNALALMGVGT